MENKTKKQGKESKEENTKLESSKQKEQNIENIKNEEADKKSEKEIKESAEIETKPKDEKKQEIKVKDKKEVKIKKDKAIVNGRSLRISSKHSFAIAKMLKGKTPDKAIEILNNVVKKRRAVPMNNREVPHKKDIMSGSYPRNAALEFIKLIEQLKANSVVNGIENPVISIIKADKASRPFRREGKRAKRTHVFLEAHDRIKINEQIKK
ncbi:MAG: uL22 family ribosomal protein [Nanoarchaeota archaeon]